MNANPAKPDRNRFGYDTEGFIIFGDKRMPLTWYGSSPEGQHRAGLVADWLNQCAQIIESGAPLPASIQEALNSGDGSYRP